MFLTSWSICWPSKISKPPRSTHSFIVCVLPGVHSYPHHSFCLSNSSPFLKTQLNFFSFIKFSQIKSLLTLNLLHNFFFYFVIFILQNTSFPPIGVREKKTLKYFDSIYFCGSLLNPQIYPERSILSLYPFYRQFTFV